MRIGNELWAGCWYGGVRGIDVSDISKPLTRPLEAQRQDGNDPRLFFVLSSNF
jgi:hypothetical protein